MRTDPTIRAIEEHGFNSWPALDTLVADGWLFRFAAGHTRRANSVNAYAPRPDGFDGVVAMAERLYPAAGLVPTFRITPLAPPEADRTLAAQGWARRGDSLVLAGGVDPDVVAPAGVTLEPQPSRAWITHVSRAHALPDREIATMTRILSAIRPDTAYATAVDGGPAAFGLAVVERGLVGFHRIVTVPERRGRGAARRVMQALLAWGRDRGAASATVQVEADNGPARRLYGSLGLAERYRYHYRIKP